MAIELEGMDAPRTAEDDRDDGVSWRLAVVSIVSRLVGHEMSIGKARELLALVQTDLQRDMGCNGRFDSSGLPARVAEELLQGVDNTVEWRLMMSRKRRPPP